MNYIYSILSDRRFLVLLLVVNIFGTVYGYIWYVPQLEITPWYFIPFVPDSPTASLFFVLVVIGFLVNKRSGLLEALALLSLMKYGIWAVSMNLLMLKVNGELPWQSYMLIVSHGAMAIEGILYAPFYRIKGWHLAVSAVVLLHNEIIDYIFGMMPTYQSLENYFAQIGYFTFWLSIASLLFGYWLVMRKDRLILNTQMPSKK